jgi:hypothetical protein
MAGTAFFQDIGYFLCAGSQPNLSRRTTAVIEKVYITAAKPLRRMAG